MTRSRKDPAYLELEKISQKDLKNYRNRSNDLSNYYREHFQYFAEERKKLFDSILNSVRKNCSPIEIKNYQRTTRYKYALNPLSAKGSILSETGGRFNIGNLSPNIPKFVSFRQVIIHWRLTINRVGVPVTQAHKKDAII